MSISPVVLLALVACLCVGLAVVLVAAVFYFGSRGVQDINRIWGDLGLTTGLALKPAGTFSQPELSGQYRQRPIHLYTVSTGAHRNRTTYTEIELTIRNPAGASLEITPASGVGGFLDKMLNAQDVQVGDAAFDQRFAIKSDPPDFAAAILGDDRLRGLVAAIPGEFRVAVEGGCVEYSKRGLEEDTQLLVRLFNTLSDLADQVEAHLGRVAAQLRGGGGAP